MRRATKSHMGLWPKNKSKTNHFSCNLGHWERHTHIEPGISNQSSIDINQKHHYWRTFCLHIFSNLKCRFFGKLLAEPPTNPTLTTTNHHQAPLPPTQPNHQLTRHLGPGLGGTTGVGAGVQGLGIWPPLEVVGSWWGFDLGAHRKPRVSPGCYLWLTKEISHMNPY